MAKQRNLHSHTHSRIQDAFDRKARCNTHKQHTSVSKRDTDDYAVIDLFLPAFDEGYLVDGRGVRHSCSRVLFVMTSNLGSALSEWMLARKHEDQLTATRVEEIVAPHVRRHLRPELLGRLSVFSRRFDRQYDPHAGQFDQLPDIIQK